MSSLLPKIQKFESLPSTNSKLKDLVKYGAVPGTLVVAETQTQGRGRLGRTWHSPKGGLYFSVLFAPKNPKRLTDLSILAGVAICQALRVLLPKQKDVSVKWPNDVLVDWKKVAGVLCETVGDPPHAVVMGIGININTSVKELEPFAKNHFSATSILIEEPGEPHSVDAILEVVVTKLFQLYELYENEGFNGIRYLWEKNCLMMGKRVELRDPNYSEADGDRGKTVGIHVGIDDTGALVLSNQKNEKRTYVSGEIACFWP